MIEVVLGGLGILIALNGMLLRYAITIERRLTKLETTIEEWRELRRLPRLSEAASWHREHSPPGQNDRPL